MGVTAFPEVRKSTEISTKKKTREPPYDGSHIF